MAWVVFLLPTLALLHLAQGVHVSTIAIKTGTEGSAESRARVVVEICDSQGTCCQSSSLDNPGKDRERGQTDVYTNTEILGNCQGSLVGEPVTAKLTTSDPHGDDGWYAEWMNVTMSTGEVFSCPVDGWLDNWSKAWPEVAGPGSRTVICTSSGSSATRTTGLDPLLALLICLFLVCCRGCNNSCTLQGENKQSL